MSSFNIKAPIGYQICERKEQMDVDTAVQVLSSKKQRKYTAAVRHDQDITVELTRHVIICPFCGNEIPAYARQLGSIFERRFLTFDKVDKTIIQEWGTRQISFLSPSILNSI